MPNPPISSAAVDSSDLDAFYRQYVDACRLRGAVPIPFEAAPALLRALMVLFDAASPTRH